MLKPFGITYEKKGQIKEEDDECITGKIPVDLSEGLDACWHGFKSEEISIFGYSEGKCKVCGLVESQCTLIYAQHRCSEHVKEGVDSGCNKCSYPTDFAKHLNEDGERFSKTYYTHNYGGITQKYVSPLKKGNLVEVIEENNFKPTNFLAMFNDAKEKVNDLCAGYEKMFTPKVLASLFLVSLIAACAFALFINTEMYASFLALFGVAATREAKFKPMRKFINGRPKPINRYPKDKKKESKKIKKVNGQIFKPI